MVKGTVPSILNNIRNIFMRLYGSVEAIVTLCLVHKILDSLSKLTYKRAQN